MRSSKSLFQVAGVLLGGLGVFVCIAAIVIVWLVSVRLGGVADGLFNKADDALTAVRDSVVEAQSQVAAARLTAEGVAKALRDWTKDQAGRRLIEELVTTERIGQLDAGLRSTDHWLEVSESSVGLVQATLTLVLSTRDPAESTQLSQLADQIAALRGQLSDIRELVTKIRERVAAPTDDKSTGERIEQAVQFAARVVATITSLDARLGSLADRVTTAQQQLPNANAITQRWILIVTLGIVLFILWMALGQAALFRLAWNRRRDAVRAI